ncbi:MAG: hypothetical protein ABJ056_10505 [Halioglobus sp.]
MTTGEQPTPARHSLRPLIRKEIDELTAAALASDEVSEETARRLKQLSELESSLPRPPAHPARRWPVILLSAGVFLIPGLMITLKVPKVEVQISVEVTELSWNQARSGEIMGPLALDSLGVSSFTSISLPPTRDYGAEKQQQAPASFRAANGSSGGKISLDTVSADKGTRVTISREPGESRGALYLAGNETQANVILSGGIAMDFGGDRLDERDFGRGRPAKVHAVAPSSLGLDLRFNDKSDVVFPAHIMIASLSLQKMEEAEIEGVRTHLPVSTVLNGKIYNESMNGASYDLRKGEWLTLQGVSGELRSLQVTENGIQLDFHGEVSDVEVGSSTNKRSLMPNWLEWFSARNSVQMLWGAFLWLLSTLFGVIKWWRRPN